MKSKSVLLLSALSLLAAACSKTTSDNVKTSGVYASYSVQARDTNRVECVVRFQVGGGTGTSLELAGADHVTCDGQPMTKSEVLGLVTYSVELPYRMGHDYEVRFTRPDEPAYTARAVLPEPLLDVSPAAPVSLPKGTPLTVSWRPSTDPADEMIGYLQFSTQSSSHVRYRADNAPENGSLVFDGEATSLTPAVAGTWNGNVQIVRRRQGAMPAGLAGSITGEQTRTIGVTLHD